MNNTCNLKIQKGKTKRAEKTLANKISVGITIREKTDVMTCQIS